jgi:hypothetical protein
MSEENREYCVECCPTRSTKALCRATFTSFYTVLAWIEQQLQVDEQRVAKIPANGSFMREQERVPSRYKLTRN